MLNDPPPLQSLHPSHHDQFNPHHQQTHHQLSKHPSQHRRPIPYDTLHSANSLLKVITAPIPTTCGSGTHEYLGIVISNAFYATVSANSLSVKYPCLPWMTAHHPTWHHH